MDDELPDDAKVVVVYLLGEETSDISQPEDSETWTEQEVKIVPGTEVSKNITLHRFVVTFMNTLCYFQSTTELQFPEDVILTANRMKIIIITVEPFDEAPEITDVYFCSDQGGSVILVADFN